ncbi:hypothetical protein KVV02_000568 [Mortierella alpina]|uniref:Uncharacterized protein n=1 Tax=Mortierella alpina TaxID=64518 RepID=A0A9P8A6B7_MORAP|nr:hypothetical protein KVV02_000568 [Mortierella alpina]
MATAPPSAPTPSTMPPTYITDSYLNDEQRYCDWTLTATHCKEQNVTQGILIFSTAVHIFAAIYTIWLIIQRNGGVNKKIFTCLFTKVANRIQPRPINCIIMCIAICCISKPISNLVLVFDVLRGSLWARTLLEQIYWYRNTSSSEVLPVYLNVAEVNRSLPKGVNANTYPFVIIICGIGPSLLAALLYDRGEYEASQVWLLVSHMAWSGIIFVLVPLLMYYGIKFSRILKVNIIIAETRLGVPRSRFGLSNLNSKSPARYLFIVLQITVFGASLFAMLAALMMVTYGIFKDQLLTAKIGVFTHFYTFAWTSALPFVMIVKLVLVHIQLVRFGRKQHLFSSLYKAMDGGGDSQSAEAGPNASTCLPGRDTSVGKEWDIKYMAGVDSEASRTPLKPRKRAKPGTSNYRVPSSITRCSSLEQSLMREYPRYFTSERIAELPAYLLPAAVPDATLQAPAVPPRSASVLINPRLVSPKQRQEPGVHPSSDVKSPWIVYGARQEAFPHYSLVPSTPTQHYLVIAAEMIVTGKSTPTSTPTLWSTQSSSASTPYSVPPTLAPYAYLDDERLYCDWQLIATRCRDEYLTRLILVVSSVVHLGVAIYGVWLLIKRNGGVNSTVFDGLFARDGTKTQLRITNWVVVCIILCSILKIVSNLMTVCDFARETLWVRALLEQLYWFVLAIDGTMYVLGVADTIPFTKREGGVAVFDPEPVQGCGPYNPVYFVHPTSFQGRRLVVLSLATTFILCVGPALVSAWFYDRGDYEVSKVWLDVRHANWALIFFLVAIVFLYYGMKFSRILKINILLTEAKLGVQPAPFGISNYLSWSPARVLTTMLAAHFYALALTCGVPALFAAKLFLMHVQLIRNRTMQMLFRAMDGRVNPCRLGTESDLEKCSIPDGVCVDREFDPEYMDMAAGALDATIAREPRSIRAQGAMRRTSNSSWTNITAPSSILATGAPWEYPQYFLSESIAALPACSHVPPLLALPESRQLDVAKFSLAGPALRRFTGQLPRQRQETDSDQSLTTPPPSAVVYGAPQQAFHSLGIFKLMIQAPMASMAQRRLDGHPMPGFIHQIAPEPTFQTKASLPTASTDDRSAPLQQKTSAVICTRKSFWTQPGIKAFVDWFTTPENFDRLNNQRSNMGERIIDVQTSLAEYVNSRDGTKWTWETVRGKVAYAKALYKKAAQLTRHPGEDEDTFQARKLDICPYFDRFHAVYASSLPLKASPLQPRQLRRPQGKRMIVESSSESSDHEDSLHHDRDGDGLGQMDGEMGERVASRSQVSKENGHVLANKRQRQESQASKDNGHVLASMRQRQESQASKDNGHVLASMRQRQESQASKDNGHVLASMPQRQDKHPSLDSIGTILDDLKRQANAMAATNESLRTSWEEQHGAMRSHQRLEHEKALQQCMKEREDLLQQRVQEREKMLQQRAQELDEVYDRRRKELEVDKEEFRAERDRTTKKLETDRQELKNEQAELKRAMLEFTGERIRLVAENAKLAALLEVHAGQNRRQLDS